MEIKSRVYTDGPLNEEFSEFLKTPSTNDMTEKDGCNFFVFIFDGSSGDIAHDYPEWVSDTVCEATFLACKKPKSTFILVDKSDTIITETCRLYWQATGTNLYIVDNLLEIFPEVANKVDVYAKFINDRMGDK